MFRLVARIRSNHFLNQLLDCDAFGFRVESQRESMPQNRQRHRSNIICGGMLPAFKKCPCLGRRKAQVLVPINYGFKLAQKINCQSGHMSILALSQP